MNKLTLTIPWFKEKESYLKKSSNHHAFIFEGPRGIGKIAFIHEIAKGFLCKESPNIQYCNKCKSCHLYNESNHPDFYAISLEEGKKQISINQIKNLQESIYESSFLGSNKVFLVSPLEKLNKEAFNSFLKNLEEPPLGSIFLLITNRPQEIPLTIRSRCLSIQMEKPKEDLIKDWLNKNFDGINNLDLVLKLSKGKPIIASDMIHIKIEEIRNEFFNEMAEFLKTGSNLIEISEKWPKDKSVMLIKLEWMSDLIMDCLRYRFLPQSDKTLDDTSEMCVYLSNRVSSDDFFKILDKTNFCWNTFNSDSNLREDYHLKSLLSDWTKHIGLSS